MPFHRSILRCLCLLLVQNPLMYWAIGRDFDLIRISPAMQLFWRVPGAARQSNANVLLKTQLAYAGWMSLAI
jgi:hypothetical protein